MLVPQTGTQEVLAAGFKELDLGGVVETRFVSRTDFLHLPAWRTGDGSVGLR